MKISAKLEEMVADLVSDEKAKREEVEGVLSQIHELTAAYFEPTAEPQVIAQTPGEMEAKRLAGDSRPLLAPLEPRQDTTSLDAQLQNMIAFNVRRGDDKETAERKARLALGIE